MAENPQDIYFVPRENQQSPLTLKDIVEMVWTRKWWYVLSILICLVFAAIYLYRTPSVYQRTAKVIINEDGQDAALRDLASFTGGMTGKSSGENVNNEVEAFASPDLMQIVVERLGLQTTYTEKQIFRSVEHYTDTPVELKVVESIPQSSFSFSLEKRKDGVLVLSDFMVGPEKIKADAVTGLPSDTLMTPVGRLMLTPTVNFAGWDKPYTIKWVNSMGKAKSYCRNLSATISGKQTSVIVLSLEDVFPARAENILNTLIDVYNETWIHDKNRSARNTTAFINERLIVIEQELGGIETDLKEFKQENKLTDIQMASQAYLQESTTYSAQAFDVNNQLTIAQYIRGYITDPSHSRDLIPANSGLTNSDIESQITEYNDMVLTRDRLLAGSSEKNPLVLDMNTSLNAMKTTIIRSIDNLVAALELQADRLKGQEEQIMGRIVSSSGTEMELLSIERQQKVKESLYIYLLQKREENEIAGLVNVGNTRLIMSPNGSPSPVSPNRMMVLLVAIILGCGIPFGISLILKMTDTSVKCRKDIEKSKVPFLGDIPLMGEDKRSGLSRLKKKDRFDTSNCRIMVKSGKRDSVNEAFRVLRTNIDMMAGKGDRCSTMIVTSLNPNAGKTFVIMNVAAGAALKGARTLLLDLDLRKATLSKSLEMNGTGTVAYLTGKTDDFRGCIRTVSENLSILPVGSIPPNPSELLLSDRFESMLMALKKEYDYIFIDCPPVEIVADTYIISRYADMTLFVVRSGLLDRRDIPILDRLYSDGKLKHMSLILNGVEAFSHRYGRYGYGYGYGNAD